jgi:hypothetical protein
VIFSATTSSPIIVPSLVIFQDIVNGPLTVSKDTATLDKSKLSIPSIMDLIFSTGRDT